MLLGDLTKRCEATASGVGKQNVEASFLVFNGGVDAIEVCKVGDVTADASNVAFNEFHGGVEFGFPVPLLPTIAVCIVRRVALMPTRRFVGSSSTIRKPSTVSWKFPFFARLRRPWNQFQIEITRCSMNCIIGASIRGERTKTVTSGQGRTAGNSKIQQVARGFRERKGVDTNLAGNQKFVMSTSR